jgi:stage V sporulation protein S
VVVVEILKVSAKSNPKSVAKALALLLRREGKAELHAVGAGAVNQAVKAAAVARGLVAPNGIDAVIIPAFMDLEIDGEERTGVKLIVQAR